MKGPALQIDNLSHRYGAHEALCDVSLSVGQGQFHALLGVNGAGKSTLFGLVTRLLGLQSGRIAVAGEPLGPRSLGRIGTVFQSRALDPELTVRQNLTYHAALHGIARRKAAPRIEELLDAVALSDKAGARVRSLSGGQARRAEIARAMIHRPALLLLDEATVGLDVGSRADVMAMTRQMVARDGAAVLWATHLLDEITPEDGLSVLHRGRLLWQGSAADFAPGGDMQRAFLAATGKAEGAAA
ncbi:MAG: ATP-binding cassette domain-containing protein [Paracoccus sp. (in: a-proteobacteria)]|nr:ATP-binding cassette domain-containing protein [Paracoccus sp. (in: a-proteobacteria)]